MKILTLLSCLIDYPTEELYQAKAQVEAEIHADTQLTVADKQALLGFVATRFSMDLLDWQSEYDALFERGRSLSLLLFEHVHGESRDRGQAMIDLIAQYKQAGLALNANELPDYIPLYLEFLSTQGTENAQAWLQDVAHIIALLKVRLDKRECDYSMLFGALVSLSGAQVDYQDLASQVKSEKRDDTKEAIDKVWEEEMVRFGGDGGPDSDAAACGSAINKPAEGQRRDQEVPIQIFDQQPTSNASSNSVAGGY